MIELNNRKVIKIGDSYGIVIPKALINCKVIKVGDQLNCTVRKVEKAFYGNKSRDLTFTSLFCTTGGLLA